MPAPTRSILASIVSAVALTMAFVVLGPSAQAVTPGDYGAAAVKATNAARASHGIRRLRTDRCLQRFAARQAARMALRREMFHQDIGIPLLSCGLHSVGENVAVGYPTGRAVVRQGWMKSPPHRANILRRGFRLVAVAAAKGPDGRWYASQVFGSR